MSKLGGIDPDEADLAAVGENDGIAVYDVANDRSLIEPNRCAGRNAGPPRRGPEYENSEKNDPKADGPT